MRLYGLSFLGLVLGLSLACGGSEQAATDVAPPADAPADVEADEGEGDEAAEGEGEGEEAAEGEGEGEGDEAGEGDEPGEGEGEEAGEGDEGSPDEAPPDGGQASPKEGKEGKEGKTSKSKPPASEGPPKDLDPASTKPADRKRVLVDKYKAKRDATEDIVRVLKTDPDGDVRATAADVIGARWRSGIDTAASQQAVLWCADKGGASTLRAKCLRLAGEKGSASAGEALARAVGDGDKAVSEAATAACGAWVKRFPSGVKGSSGPCGPTNK